MEICNTDYALYVQDGEHDPKQVTNFTPVIEPLILIWRVRRTSRHIWALS